MLFRAFWNWVDAFVVMSGLLTAFYAFKKLRTGQKLNIPKMYIQRYIKCGRLEIIYFIHTFLNNCFDADLRLWLFSGLSSRKTSCNTKYLAKIL